MEVRVRAEKGRRSPDHLNDLRLRSAGQLARGVPGLHFRVLSELDLDELVSAQGIIERLQQRRRQAVLPDVDVTNQRSFNNP